jgi:D-3-phosphoglycerate dehydrogenase
LTGEAAMRMSVSAAQNIIDYFNECLEPSLVVNPEVLAINAVMNPLP